MTLDRYAGWLARGRAHQQDGRIIDALLCYRRALREIAGGVEARFHIGEIAWRFGNAADAIAAWRSAIEISQNHLPSWHALADAYAAKGEFAAAADAVRHVLAIQPAEPRARALDVALQAAAGGHVDDAVLAEAIASDARWPPGLLAAVATQRLTGGRSGQSDRSLTALLRAAKRVPVTVATHDALRLLALALVDGGLFDEGQAFAERYLRSCDALDRPSMPLLWPMRTAGAGLRIGLLVTEQQLALAETIAAKVRETLGAHYRCMAFVDRVSGDAPALSATLDVRVMPSDVDAAARGIAVLDLDVLVDIAGLRAPNGPLLARQPARERWAFVLAGMPVVRTAYRRTYDQSGDDPVAALVRGFGDAQATLADRAPCGSSAAELAVLWDDAVLAHQRMDTVAARAGYAAVLVAQPDSVPALYLSALLAREAGDLDAAREGFRATVLRAPAFVDARAALSRLEMMNGRPDVAVDVAKEGLASAPDAAILWRALGEAELKRGDAAAAAAAFVEALQRDPTHAETHYNHGVALQMARNAAEAARAYQRALAFAPDLYAADFNLGVIFDQQGNAPAAIAAFANVLARAPKHAAAYKALAETLLAAGRIDAWFANFDRFEQNCPEHLALAALALEVCAYRADYTRLNRYLDGLRDEKFPAGDPLEVLDALQQILYLLHFFDVDHEIVGRIGRTHDALSRRIYGEPRPARALRAPGKLRVGYLSADFRDHVMGKMMYEALRHHDRRRVDVFGYSTSAARDAWTERYETLFGTLPDVSLSTDRDAAQRIAADDLDILVDLSTHTKGARPGILALKPARVQITHVATAGTLAMSAIDFKLTDRYADVEYDPRLQVEPLLVMDGCAYPFRHVAAAPAGLFARERLGVPASAVLIGAFFTPLKLSQRCLALWREALRRLPDALLAFSPVRESLRPVFQHVCAAAGIDGRRIVFVPQGRDDAENQARYRLIDFVLDPMPYGGVNGTLEALDMHVPVVTLVGRRHAERTSYSILTNLGVTHTVAQTGGEYVDTAVRLATDETFMRTVRDAIATALPQSPLTDMPAHTANLERAYREAFAARSSATVDDGEQRGE